MSDIKNYVGISVIMPVWNTKSEWLEESINSVLNQTYQHFELIITNDGSNKEETLTTLNKYRNHPKIKIIDLKENKGVIIARNIAIKSSKYDYIALLDSDDICFPERFERQINFLYEHPDIDVVGSGMILIDAYTKENIRIEKLNYSKYIDKNIWTNSNLENFIANSTVIMKKKCLIDSRINFYNEDLIDNNILGKCTFPEDFDLWLRMLEVDYKFLIMDEVLIFYRTNNQNSLSSIDGSDWVKKHNIYKFKNRVAQFREKFKMSQKIIPNTTIVSAFIPNLNGNRDIEKYLELGKDLLKLDFPKIIFLPNELFDWAQEYINDKTQLIKFEKNEIYNYFWNELDENEKLAVKLPLIRNQEKDTLDYIICQNNKINWIKKAKDINYFNSENFIWLDFGIKHVINFNLNSFFDNLNIVYHNNKKIIMPTGYNFPLEIIDFDKVCWLTLGGVVLLHESLIDNFYQLNRDLILKTIKTQQKLTWEVNIWSQLHLENPDIIELYYADHNDSILLNLQKFITNKVDYLQLLNEKRMNGDFTKVSEIFTKCQEMSDYYLKNKEFIDYEMTILNYYINNNKTNGAKFSINFLNTFNLNENNVWTNLKYYVNTLRKESNCFIKRLETLDIEGFINSSPCKIIMKNGQTYTNIRQVNYQIKRDTGKYFYFNTDKHMTFENCLNKPVSTLNVYNNKVLNEINNTGLEQYKGTIKGIEDIRLFEKDNHIKFLATTRDYNSQNKNEICTGDYIPELNTIVINKVFVSPESQNCEKNWTMLNENEIIYKWNPITIYSYETLEKLKEFKVPKIFKHFRGGSSCIDIDGFKYCLVHTAHYENPRKYLHWIVKLDQTGYPLAYSTPFDFEGERIEYGLSMNLLENGNLEFHYSIWDSASKSLEIPFSYFEDKFIEIKEENI